MEIKINKIIPSIKLIDTYDLLSYVDFLTVNF